jgi:hypothetical protein
MNDQPTDLSNATDNTEAPRGLAIARRIYGWDIGKARAQAAKGKPVALVRPDGTNSGLCVTPAGELRRAVPKPQGKAARKQFKRLRQRLRAMDPDKEAGAMKVLKRQAARLCIPGGVR